jgi:hypothetical protein
MEVVKAIKGLIAFTPEIDCDQMAIGLPPVISAVFLKAKILVIRGYLVDNFEMPLLHFRDKA